MAPAANSVSATPKSNRNLNGDYQVVAWDLDTTGRRLIDEICQIGGFYVLANSPKNEEPDKEKSDQGSSGGGEYTFSQYVMPYKNPNPGARRSFGIKVVSVGRYRMLKDLDTGKILKTKSEVSALQDFLDWLKEAKSRSGKDGILLACHEPNRKVLVPLLLEALYKYNLLEYFNETVCGFVNGVSVVEALGSEFSITSHSLRSLCKTVLSDTNPTTASASDRSKVLIQIISKVCSPSNTSTAKDSQPAAVENANSQGSIRPFDLSKALHVATTVQQEELELKHLKGMLDTQGTLRPIFESYLRQKRSVRERAMQLRKIVAESGLDYEKVAIIFHSSTDAATNEQSNQDHTTAASDDEKEAARQKEEDDVIKEELKLKIPEANDQDIEELIELFKGHFRSLPNSSTANNASNNEEDSNTKSTGHTSRESTSAITNKTAVSASNQSLSNKAANKTPYNKKKGGSVKPANAKPMPNANRSNPSSTSTTAMTESANKSTTPTVSAASPGSANK